MLSSISSNSLVNVNKQKFEETSGDIYSISNFEQKINNQQFYSLNSKIYKLNSISFRICFTLFILYFFIKTTQSKCQKSVLQKQNTKKYDTFQMCYFQFGTHLYFLKCQKKVNCSKNPFPIDQRFNQFQQRFHPHGQKCETQIPTMYDTNQCQQLCCQQFRTSTYYENQAQNDIYTIQYCKDMADYRIKVTILTVLVIAIPVCFLICCTIVTCFFRRRHPNQALTGIFGQTAQSFIKEEDIHLSKLQIQGVGPQYFNAEQNCAVCLDASCNAYTNCGHYYHPKCLRQWLVKRPRCPVCMSNKYNPIKIYCKNCKLGVKFEVFKRTKLQQVDNKELQLLQSFKCQNCIKYPKQKQKQFPSTKMNSININDSRNKKIQFQDDEEHVSIIQFSEELKTQRNNIIQQRVSTTSLDIAKNRYFEGKKHNNFDQSVHDYISSFKKMKEKSRQNKLSKKNIESTPTKSIQKSLQSKGTPNKLLQLEQNLEKNQRQKDHQVKDQIRQFEQFQQSLHFSQVKQVKNKEQREN